MSQAPHLLSNNLGSAFKLLFFLSQNHFILAESNLRKLINSLLLLCNISSEETLLDTRHRLGRASSQSSDDEAQNKVRQVIQSIQWMKTFSFLPFLPYVFNLATFNHNLTNNRHFLSQASGLLVYRVCRQKRAEEPRGHILLLGIPGV